MFVNAPAGDFRLQADSPGVNQGVNLSPIVTTDITGASRDGSYDIGAYESDGVVPSLSPPEVISDTTAVSEQ